MLHSFPGFHRNQVGTVLKCKARWEKLKREMKRKGRWPTRDQIISDKHQMSTEFIHSTISRPHSTLYVNISLCTCMDPLAIVYEHSWGTCAYALPQNGEAYRKLNLKSRNCVPKRRPIRTKRRPWALLFPQKKGLSTQIRWNYSKGFRIAMYYPWILRSEYVLVIKSYDRAGKWVSQSTDLLGQVSFSCLASPFVSVLSLSSWHLTKAQNDRQLLMTS